MSGLDKVTEQVNAIDQELARKLYGTREFTGIVDATNCKSCGYENAVAEYEYTEWVDGLIGSIEVVIGKEVVCHDCAWPKNGEYLRAKEKEREERRREQKKQREKETITCS